MPYNIRETKGGKWETYNTETGDVKGTHATREKALAQMRLLYAVEHGDRLRGAERGVFIDPAPYISLGFEEEGSG